MRSNTIRWEERNVFPHVANLIYNFLFPSSFSAQLLANPNFLSSILASLELYFSFCSFLPRSEMRERACNQKRAISCQSIFLTIPISTSSLEIWLRVTFSSIFVRDSFAALRTSLRQPRKHWVSGATQAKPLKQPYSRGTREFGPLWFLSCIDSTTSGDYHFWMFRFSFLNYLFHSFSPSPHPNRPRPAPPSFLIRLAPCLTKTYADNSVHSIGRAAVKNMGRPRLIRRSWKISMEIISQG